MFNASLRFKRAVRASSRAVAKFLRTEAALLKQNERLTASITDINDELFRLEEIRRAAIDQRTGNEAVAKRIRDIVDGSPVV